MSTNNQARQAAGGVVDSGQPAAATAASLPLSGCGVVLTRPAGTAAEALADLHRLGAQACNLAVIDLQPLPISQVLLSGLHAAEQADAVVFASPAAVQFCFLHKPDFKPQGCVFAQGPGTQQALAAHAIVAMVPTAGFTTEDLLELPWFQQVAGKSIVRIAGRGGREELIETLLARQAKAQAVAVYERLPAYLGPKQIQSLAAMADPLLVISSAETLHALPGLLPEKLRQQLRGGRIVVSSERLAHLAQHAGFTRITMAASAVWADLRATLLSLAEADRHG